ncbi:MAG: Ig-like domain-containing protein [Acidobacteria bacterium]|nr:Ig-like domain-containing protein [Acidobacteriota bacterium]
MPNNNVGGQSLGAGPITIVDFATVENIGATALTITDVAVSEGFGQYEPTGLPAMPKVLQPGDTFTFDLNFDPSAIGLQRGIIQISSDDPETPNLNLSAIGVGLADVGTALDYGNDFVAVETPFVPGSPVLRVISDDGGNWQFFLPNDEPFHSVICDPVSGLCAHNYDVSAASGQPTVIHAPEFLPPVSVDTDGDGLTDDWEFAVGTRADESDTDGDGLSDFVEVILLGTDPFGGLAFPTGIIATLDLVGEAKEVVVEQVTDNGTSQIAYVATGSDGMSLIDTSQFDDPILLSRIALAGDNRDVAVDTSLGIAAVTGGTSGLHLVNVANTMSPALIQTVALPPLGAARVEVFEGVAYVASGGNLISVDLLTGEIIQTLVLGGTLSDVVREGTMLYTMDTGRILRAVDISDFDMLQRGSLNMTHAGGRLFAGNDIVYATAQSFFRGGFSTADVSDPDNITEISPSDVPNTQQSPRTAIAANGSGLAVLVGFVGATEMADLMNVIDPAETNVFQTRFELPERPNSVFIASGIAFIADGTAGLQVVNYLGFDNQGVPPVVTLSSAIPDLDPGTAGVQITEGASVPIKIEVTDAPFQVRSVDLIVNGEIVGTDVSFPFDLFAIAVSEGSTVEVRARATDTGGNSALSNILTFELVPDTFAPTITRLTPGDGQEWAEGLSAVQVRFNEAIDAATVNAANFQLKDSVGAVIAPLVVALGNRDRAVLLTYPPQPPGSYSVVIDAALVTDRAGNALGVADIVSQFTLVEATVFWVGSSGNWDDPTHWNRNTGTGVLPGPTDKVFIGSVVGNITVTHRSGTNSVKSINSHENFVMTGGSLALAEASKFKDLTLSCCTLSGSGDITVRDTMTWTGGTLSGSGAINIPATGVLNITGTGDDTRLLTLLESVSRLIDRYCNRHFYALNATRKFDGEGIVGLLVPDLISIDTNGLKTDDNKDRTFETAWAATDYLLLPSNADPASSGNPGSRPYTSIEVDVDAGTKGAFPVGRETVQVAGQWGWWRHLKTAAETANTIADATTTSVEVSSRTDVEAGHTILIDSEQMFVESYSTNVLTVVRGVNGTTAASHDNAKAIDMVQTYSVEQGLTPRKQPLEEIFAEEVILAEESLG